MQRRLFIMCLVLLGLSMYLCSRYFNGGMNEQSYKTHKGKHHVNVYLEKSYLIDLNVEDVE